ncbi:30S ribosomal protein S20, partial [bacterium]|nr:30S ribosomal protein S20 [bacterium]
DHIVILTKGKTPRYSCAFFFICYIVSTMPITSSAKKALRASKKKRVFNTRRKEALREAVKEVKKFVVAKSSAGAEKILSAAYQAIDKAAKRGIIKKNTAARKKSRLAKMLGKKK